MEKSKKKKYLIAGIVLTICIMIGTSYAWWTSSAKQTGINEIQSDCLSIAIEDEKDAINLPYAYPLTDEEAKKLEPYTFTIANKCNTKVNYIVKLEELKTKGQADAKILKSEYVAIEVNNGQKQLLNEYPTITSSYTEKEYESVEAKNIINGTLEGNEKRNYQIKLWMDEHVTLQDDATNKSFISKIVVDGGMNDIADYTEPILHGADPVLEGSSKPVAMLTANEISEEPTTTDKLIPVIIDDKGTVTKANIKEEWYNYEDKKWANAVILIDGAKEYQDGETIPEDQIESYFVWIPKYKYKIFDMGDYESIEETTQDKGLTTAIEIEFGLKDTQDEMDRECATPMLDNGVQGASGSNGNCHVGNWMTHSAFKSFKDSKGMWIGKFETSNNNDNIQIKNNTKAWANTTVSNSFLKSRDYNPDLYSHMMKNTEWGAVAYLTQSIYGRCTMKGNAVNCVEITQNKNRSSLTGYNADISYPKSQNASTTGNITGIFDMNGGIWEQMASVMKNKDNDIPMWSQSDLNGDVLSDKRYYDLYNYAEDDRHWNRRILGDATGELGLFGPSNLGPISSYFADLADFVNKDEPWFYRGGDFDDNDSSGIFAFSRDVGRARTDHAFRIVLTPVNK